MCIVTWHTRYVHHVVTSRDSCFVLSFECVSFVFAADQFFICSEQFERARRVILSLVSCMYMYVMCIASGSKFVLCCRSIWRLCEVNCSQNCSISCEPAAIAREEDLSSKRDRSVENINMHACITWNKINRWIYNLFVVTLVPCMFVCTVLSVFVIFLYNNIVVWYMCPRATGTGL